MKLVKRVTTEKWLAGLAAAGLVLLTALPRLTALNRYLIVDEADRWRWAENFVYALSRGELAGTLVGDGYPGIVPVWASTVWIFLEALRRSLMEGQWIGQPGLYLLFHQWDRPEFLIQQRLPIVLLNILLALLILWLVWRLFGGRVALLSGLLIALDPFYLSDSRVNRAEAVIAGLMTLSMLCLILYDRRRRYRYAALSGILGGLSFLTKIQALAMLPAVAVIGLVIYLGWPPFTKRGSDQIRRGLGQAVLFGLVWAAAAGLTWFILWPAMWVIPLDTLSLVYSYATRKVGAEGVNLFFMGETFEDADPGLLFYPLVFLMRITPLVLIGLLGAVSRFALYLSRRRPEEAHHRDLPDLGGSFILVIYILLYALVMSLGSHKQDRYLLPIFLSLDILAAQGLLYLWTRLKRRLARLSFNLRRWGVALLAGLLLAQVAVVAPHHPYYYSYFNPLFGGGQAAARTLRIGWGEGMDQVGAYLAAKPDSRDLVVASRFTHNMLGFKGELISLTPGGRWTQADYIVLYIQQVQRRQEPSPAFIDYFLARPPEKVIRLGGIEYAWIYPIPFTTPADPRASQIPDQASLLGYSWEPAERTGEPANGERATEGLAEGEVSPGSQRIRVLWENLGLAGGRQLAARLVGERAESDWTSCRPDPAFVDQARRPGAYVESVCAPALTKLSPGTYTVEFGLALPAWAAGSTSPAGGQDQIEPFPFPQGRHAALISGAGQVEDTPEADRLAAIAAEAIPAGAERLDRIYDGRLKLAAYQLEPARPQPGDRLEVTLSWQPIEELRDPLHLVVQLADSRRLSLGRVDANLPADSWLPGEVAVTRHEFTLSPDLETPLAARLEVSLLDQADVTRPVTTLSGRPLDLVAARFTVSPPAWPDLAALSQSESFRPVEAAWQNGLTLSGYSLSPTQVEPGQSVAVTLYWETARPVEENYAVFVHLLDEAGQIRTQNDALPRAGAYPTPWWQPGRVIEDPHALSLPPDLPPGTYRLAVGFYAPEGGERLEVVDQKDSVVIGALTVR